MSTFMPTGCPIGGNELSPGPHAALVRVKFSPLEAFCISGPAEVSSPSQGHKDPRQLGAIGSPGMAIPLIPSTPGM